MDGTKFVMYIATHSLKCAQTDVGYATDRHSRVGLSMDPLSGVENDLVR